MRPKQRFLLHAKHLIDLILFLRKVKSQDSRNSMKENGKQGEKSRKRGTKGLKKKGRIDLLIRMTLSIL